jgi:protoporphyrinogen oxidase
MSARHCVVVGGGFAGVSAAVALHEQGARVTLLEQKGLLGGRARSDVIDGLTIDTGAQLASSSFTRTLRLLHASRGASDGVDGAMRSTAGRDALVLDGTRYPVQFGSVRSLLGFARLGAMEKLRLGTHLLPLLAMHRGHLDAAAEQVPESLDRESARRFVVAHVGEHAADVLVEPPLNPFYAASGDETSLAFFLTLGRYGSESDVLAATTGWSSVLAVATQAITVECGLRVVSLAIDGDTVYVDAADGRRWTADGVVIATGAHTARLLLASVPASGDELTRWLAQVESRRTWTLALAVTGAPRRDAFGLFAHPSHARAVSACAIHGAKLGTAAPADRDVVLAWPTPAAAAELADAPAERIVDAMLPEVEHLVPEVRGRITRARLYRFDEGTPLARPGFGVDRARGRALVASLPLPVTLAGDYLTTPLIEGAVASGEHAARLLWARTGAGRGMSAPR